MKPRHDPSVLDDELAQILAAHYDRVFVVVRLHDPVICPFVSVIEALSTEIKSDQKLVWKIWIENKSIAGEALELLAVVIAVGISNHVGVIDRDVSVVLDGVNRAHAFIIALVLVRNSGLLEPGARVRLSIEIFYQRYFGTLATPSDRLSFCQRKKECKSFHFIILFKI